MFNNLIIRYLYYNLAMGRRRLRAFLTLFWGMQNRGVLLCCQMAYYECKSLIASMLNSIFALGFAKESMYLCIAKVPYYGRSAYRHRANDNASPLRDAAGSRGNVSKGGIIV